MKGIILAGGSGTRLYPITEGISKQLMPIYDKPMIYYPLWTLMMAEVKDILIITTREDQKNFQRLLKKGEDLGINIEYLIQEKPEGLAQSFIIGEKFIGNDSCVMILGDNIFYGSNFKELLIMARDNAIRGYATIFGSKVRDPQRFGIMEVDKNENIISVEEKPIYPKSNYAITGLYFYPRGVSEKASQITKSLRGEYEITALNNLYLQDNRLKAKVLGNDFTWFDTGTFDSQLEASNMIRALENNKDRVICCPEEISFRNGWINEEKVLKRAKLLEKNSYGRYLSKMVMEREK